MDIPVQQIENNNAPIPSPRLSRRQTGSPVTSSISSNLPSSITPVWLRSSNASILASNVHQSTTITEEETLERDSMQKERHWLLVNEVPFVCYDLKRIIENALDTLSSTNYSSQKKKKNPVDEKAATSPVLTETAPIANNNLPSDSQVLTFESNESILKGSIKVEGWNISEADITIKSSRWNKNSPFRCGVTPIHPLKLYQIHNCYNFLKTALEIILKLEKLVAATKDTGYVDDIRVNRIMKDVSSNLKSAMEELLFAMPAFPDNTLFSSTVFQPHLPQDLIVESNISNKEIIVTVYCLHIITHKPPKTSKYSSPPKVGEILQCVRNGLQYWVEVVDYAQVKLSSDKVNSSFALINTANQLCAELRDKLAIFL